MNDLIVKIYNQSLELIVKICHIQDKPQLFFLIDVKSVKDQIVAGEVLPENDWDETICPKQGEKQLDESIEKHYQVAIRQVVYIGLRYDWKIRSIEEDYSGAVKDEKIKLEGQKMLSALECANQHWAAYHILKAVRHNDYTNRGRKGGVAKQAAINENTMLLRGLVRNQLTNIRPRGGWGSVISTSDIITKNLFPLIKEHNLWKEPDKDKLYEHVTKLIERDDVVSKLYKNNAKKLKTN